MVRFVPGVTCNVSPVAGSVNTTSRRPMGAKDERTSGTMEKLVKAAATLEIVSLVWALASARQATTGSIVYHISVADWELVDERVKVKLNRS